MSPGCCATAVLAVTSPRVTRYRLCEPTVHRAKPAALLATRCFIKRDNIASSRYYRAVRNIQHLVHRISPLVEPLHDAFGHARHRLEVLGITTGDDKRWLRTAHYRSEVFDYLSAHAVDSWSIDWKRHSQNGAIHLIHSGSDLAIRLLREAPTPGGVPCAGSNTRRRAYYRNRPCADVDTAKLLDPPIDFPRPHKPKFNR